MQIQIDASTFRNAQLATSDDDMRPYLTGVLLTPAGEVVATNGHILYMHKSGVKDCTLSAPIIVRLSAKLPKNASTLWFDYDEETRKITDIKTSTSRGGIKLWAGEVIDAKFPDFTLVIPAADEERVPVNAIGLGGKYVIKGMEIFGDDSVFNFNGVGSAVVIARTLYTADTKELLVVMPCRID